MHRITALTSQCEVLETATTSHAHIHAQLLVHIECQKQPGRGRQGGKGVNTGLDWIEHCFTSPRTQYRYGKYSKF